MITRIDGLLDRLTDRRVLPALAVLGIGSGGLAWLGVPTPGALAAVWLCVVPLALVARIAPREDRNALVALVSAALAVRLILAAAIDLVLADAVFGLFDDTLRYEEIGRVMAEAWRAHGNADIYALYQLSVAGYFYVVAGLDFIAGGGPFLIAAFNAMLAGITVPVLYWLAAHLRATRQERLVAAAVGTFMPSVVLWSAIPLKDTFVSAAFALGVLAAFRLGVGRGLRPALWLLTIVVCVLALATVRLYATLFLGAMAVVCLVLTGAWRRRPVWSLASVIVVVAVQFWTLQGPVGTLITTVATDVNELDRIKALLDQGGSGTSGRVGPSFSIERVTPVPVATTAGPRATAATATSAPTATPARTATPAPTATPSSAGRARYVDLLVHIPVGVALFLILPIPFLTPGTSVRYAIPEMVIWYLLLPLVLLGLAALWRRDRSRTAALIVLALGVAVIYGTFVGNAGSILRYRSQEILLLSTPIAVAAVSQWRAWRVRRLPRG